MKNLSAKADRVSLWILTAGALLVAAGILASAVGSIIAAATSGSTTIRLAAESPVPADYFPAREAPEGSIFTGLQVPTGSLSSGVTVWITLADTIMALSYLLVALSVAYLGWRMLRGDVFRRSLTVATLTAGAALIIGWAIATAITLYAEFAATAELVGDTFMSPENPFTFTFDPAPAVIGIALGIVASAFEFGEKLRADTQGLV